MKTLNDNPYIKDKNKPMQSSVNVDVVSSSSKKNITDLLNAYLPVTFGYTYRFEPNMSVSAGALVFGACSIIDNFTMKNESSIRYSPDFLNASKTTSDKETINLLEKASFVNRLFYGCGADLSVSFRHYFLRYRYLIRLDHLDVSRMQVHSLCVGMYF